MGARARSSAGGRGRLGEVHRTEGIASSTDPLRLLLEVAVFAAGVAASFAADHAVLALVFAGLVLAHLSLTFVLGQRPR